MMKDVPIRREVTQALQLANLGQHYWEDLRRLIKEATKRSTYTVNAEVQEFAEGVRAQTGIYELEDGSILVWGFGAKFPKEAEGPVTSLCQHSLNINGR